MKNLKTLLIIFAIATVAGVFYLNAMTKSDLANANGENHNDDEECNNQYAIEKSTDYNDSKVTIDFINTQSSGNPDTINITADSGYQLISVYLDVSNDNQSGYVNNTSHFPGSYNPTGDTINSAKVIVKKVCASPTHKPSNTPTPSKKLSPTPTREESCSPIPSQKPSKTPTVTPQPTFEPSTTPIPTYTPTVTPVPTQGQGGICDEGQTFNENLNICINIECDGGGTCEVTNVSPTPITSPIVTSTPTATPSPMPEGQGGTDNNSSNSNSNSNSNESKNEAAAVNSYANTGVFEETASSAMFSIGAAFTALSSAWYGKKKKTNKK